MTTIGNFEHIQDNVFQETLKLTYEAVTNTRSWKFLKDYSTPYNLGFSVAVHPKLTEIALECNRVGCGHSIASWDICMRHMEKIAKDGWDNYVTNI